MSSSLLLACTLAACNPSTVDPPVVVQPPVVKPDPVATPLADQTIKLGQALSIQTNQPFAGEWSVSNPPAWLQVSPASGTGPVAFKLTADRGLATPLQASAAALSGQLKIVWTSGTGTGAVKGTATWTVQADQYLLKGRLLDGASAGGQDVRLGNKMKVASASANEARGIIVKYREAGSAFTAQAKIATQATGKGSAAAQQAGDTLRAANLNVVSSQALSGRSVALEVGDVDAALRILRADPRVEYAVPNALLHAQSLPQVSTQALAQPLEPTDQYAGLQWPFRLLGYPAVWRDMEGGAYSKAVTVAVLDSGVRYDHPDLAETLWKPGEGALDLLLEATNGDGDGPDTDPTDAGDATRTTGSHGTHVTGIIAARWGQNAPSCAGCSPTGVVGAVKRANVKVLPIRVIDAAGNATIADVAQAVRYAAGLPITVTDPVTQKNMVLTNPHRAAVINLSLGAAVSAATAQPMCEAVQEASAAGALVIVAAGNGYDTQPYYPAACASAVAVGSVTLSGGSAPKHAIYSNAYAAVQLSAPGGTDPNRDPSFFNGGLFNGQPFPDVVLSTGWDYARGQPNYEAEAGTSQAAPQVAALAALLLSKGVTTDAASTLARMIATATDLGATGRDPLFGSGMINAAAALGAPAVSDTLGLRLQDSRGLVFQPAVDAVGRFSAYLGNGTYTVTGGRDRNGNGIYGETDEPRIQKTAVLGPNTPQVDVGDLLPK